MKNFTYYEAEKFLKQGGSSLDLSMIDLEELTTAKELSKKLDISESTANNWMTGRTDISKLGEQAIGYQLMLDLIRAYNWIPESNIVVKKQDVYEIYSKNEDGEYELLATTVNPRLARTIKEIRKVYEMLRMSFDFIFTELETREASGYEPNELKMYKTDLANLRDLIHYIQDGITCSEKCETLLKTPIDFNFTPDEIINPPELKSDNDDVFKELLMPSSRTYKGQINTSKIPEGTLIRRVIKKGEKIGEYELKKIAGNIVNLENGKKYPTINAASTDILGYEENVKENWYFYDNIHSEWKKCKYLVEDE